MDEEQTVVSFVVIGLSGSSLKTANPDTTFDTVDATDITEPVYVDDRRRKEMQINNCVRCNTTSKIFYFARGFLA